MSKLLMFLIWILFEEAITEDEVEGSRIFVFINYWSMKLYVETYNLNAYGISVSDTISYRFVDIKRCS